MIDISLDQLPPRFVASLGGRNPISACFLPEKGRYVARLARPDGKTEELEFDTALGRCLTLDERRRELPAVDRQAHEVERVTVTSTSFLDPDTGELHVRMDVDDDAGLRVTSIDKVVHDPDAWAADEVLEQVLARRRFPSEYAAWPRDRKVSHWAATLHRFRRAMGESGRDEDDVYTPDLVRDMESTDPRVRELLRDILTQVGALEQTAPAEAIAAFTTRTGIHVA
ncbi:Hypothetical protein A7982_04941 [Minicystis rosea]|nr:Hypothetical protein A7982_04941 [Minicystis rosea]